LWTFFEGDFHKHIRYAPQAQLVPAGRLTTPLAAMKSARIQSVLGLLLRPRTAPPTSFAAPALFAQTRWAHAKSEPVIPAPIPLVPDVKTFLSVIGRDMKSHASKFPTWEALFSLTSDQLRELGVEPPRARRYLLRMRKRFADGNFGPGGDLKYVEDGVARLDIHEIELNEIDRKRIIVNVPPGKRVEDIPEAERERVLVQPKGYKVLGVRSITGPFAMKKKGGISEVKVTEGMWEDKRGHKVDGGERRRDMVRFQKRVAERKALKEKQGYY
jgi:hypothetical protein